MARRLMSQISVVPYIDVMLVLLIIFMVTSQLHTRKGLVKQKAALEQSRNDLNAILSAKNEALQQLENLKATLEQSRNDLNAILSAKNEALQQLENLKATLEQSRNDLNAILSAKNEALQQLENLKATLEQSRNDLNAILSAKNEALQQLENLKSDIKSKELYLADIKRQQDAEINKEEKIRALEVEKSKLQSQLYSVQSDLEKRVSVAKSINLCNKRNHTISVALTYRQNGIPYSEGWVNVSSGKCEFVQLSNASDSQVFIYTKENERLSKKEFCMDMKHKFSIKNSDSRIWCSYKMVPIEDMVTSCIVGDGSINFVE
jgi:biopolymer transport protein ExbD/uncharacterized membrane protein